MSERREDGVSGSAVLAQRLHDAQFLERPRERHTVDLAIRERGNLATTFSTRIEVGLQPAHHDEVDLAALGVVELTRLAKADRIELLEQPGEARREAVVRRRRQEQAVLSVLGDLAEHLGPVRALAEAHWREVVRLVDDEQVPRQRVAAFQALRRGEESGEHVGLA